MIPHGFGPGGKIIKLIKCQVRHIVAQTPWAFQPLIHVQVSLQGLGLYFDLFLVVPGWIRSNNHDSIRKGPFKIISAGSRTLIFSWCGKITLGSAHLLVGFSPNHWWPIGFILPSVSKSYFPDVAKHCQRWGWTIFAFLFFSRYPGKLTQGTSLQLEMTCHSNAQVV